jgi:hypothetical protein
MAGARIVEHDLSVIETWGFLVFGPGADGISFRRMDLQHALGAEVDRRSFCFTAKI